MGSWIDSWTFIICITYDSINSTTKFGVVFKLIYDWYNINTKIERNIFKGLFGLILVRVGKRGYFRSTKLICISIKKL